MSCKLVKINLQDSNINISKPKSTEPDLHKNLEIIQKKWTTDNVSNVEQLVNLSLKNFELTMDTLSMEKINIAYKKTLFEIMSLHMAFTKKGLIHKTKDNQEENPTESFNKLYEAVYYAEQSIKGLFRQLQVLNPNYKSSMNDDVGLFRFTPIDYSKNNRFQNLLLYLLNTLHLQDLRRFNDDCYYQVDVENKNKHYKTHAWKMKCSIKEFIYETCKKEVKFEQWLNLTSNKDNIKTAIEYLKECNDPQFLPLEKNRHVFAFTNGIYITNLYINGKTYTDYFHKYSKKNFLPEEIVASKFFNQKFKNHNQKDWYDIPTPYVQKILDHQFKKEPEHNKICKTIYIMIGRMLYNVGELDDWQVILFFKGLAGTGKSTILKLISNIYDSDDIGIISNNMEKTFGLSSFANKYMAIAPEVKKDFQMPQAELQSAISGEEISIAQKFKTAQKIKWTTPIMFSGNVFPNWNNNGGSITRRFIVAACNNKVSEKDCDTNLFQKLKNEIPTLIKKSNRAYLEAIQLHKGKTIWSFIPEYFKNTQKDIAEQTNGLQHFLSSGKIVFNKEYYCREAVFKEQLSQHCRTNHYPLNIWNSDYYNGPFNETSETEGTDIQVIRKVRKLYPRGDPHAKEYHGTFILGLDLIFNSPEHKQNNDDSDEE